MKKFYLITVNCDGSVSIINEGSYSQMKKLDKLSFHRVTSINNYDKLLWKFGINS